ARLGRSVAPGTCTPWRAPSVDSSPSSDMDREIGANVFKGEAADLHSGDGRSPGGAPARLSDLIERVPDFVPGREPEWRRPVNADQSAPLSDVIHDTTTGLAGG